MKKSNKGFSLVELIIVIAIMAILAAAIAPALIRYIDKSRRADDVQAASTINSAVNSVLANEEAYDEVAQSMNGASIIASGAEKTSTFPGGVFGSELKSNLGGTWPSVKYKKDFAKEDHSWRVYISENGKAVVNIGEKEIQPEIDSSYK